MPPGLPQTRSHRAAMSFKIMTDRTNLPTLLQSSTIDKCFPAWTLIPSPATLEGYELILCRLNIVQADSTHLKLIARMAAFVTAVQASAPVVQIGRNSCQLERNSKTLVGKSRNRTGKVQPTGTEPNKSPLFPYRHPAKGKNTGPSVAQWAKGLKEGSNLQVMRATCNSSTASTFPDSYTDAVLRFSDGHR